MQKIKTKTSINRFTNDLSNHVRSYIVIIQKRRVLNLVLDFPDVPHRAVDGHFLDYVVIDCTMVNGNYEMKANRISTT